MSKQQEVEAIFAFLAQSSWIEGLDVYGYREFTPALIPTVVNELSESSWAESLERFKTDITDEGLPYYTVPEMKAILFPTAN